MSPKSHDRGSPAGYSTVSESPDMRRARARSISTELCELSSCDSDVDLSTFESVFDESVDPISFCPFISKPPLCPNQVKVSLKNIKANNPARSLAAKQRLKVVNQPIRRTVSS